MQIGKPYAIEYAIIRFKVRTGTCVILHLTSTGQSETNSVSACVRACLCAYNVREAIRLQE
jgi:hypothetical protein